MDNPSLLTSWSFEPAQVLPIAAITYLYGVRVWRLRRRGDPPPAWRVVVFATGILLLVVAVASPIAAMGEAVATTSSRIPAAKRATRHPGGGSPRRRRCQTRNPYRYASRAVGRSWSGSKLQLVSSDGWFTS